MHGKCLDMSGRIFTEEGRQTFFFSNFRGYVSNKNVGKQKEKYLLNLITLKCIHNINIIFNMSYFNNMLF